MRISELSVRRPVFATVLSMLLVIFGLVSLQRLSVREYPDIDRPTVSITTAYRGASAAIIETKITQVIEDSVAGIEGILKIESDSEDERSQVRIEFDINRDVDAAANDVRDRIARVLRGLPSEADPPQIVKADANADSVVTLAFSSDTMSMLDLTDYAERNIVDRLVDGAGRGERRHPGRPPRLRCGCGSTARRLAARQLTVTDIEDALRRENVELPAGRLESRTREFSLRTLRRPRERAGLSQSRHRARRGWSPRAARRGRRRAARGRERALLQPPERRARSHAAGAGAVEGQHARYRARRARRGRADARAACRKARRSNVSIDNALPIEAALREVLDRRRVRADVGARSHLYLPRQPARDADPGRHDPGFDRRLADRDVCARLLDQRADAARPRARDRPRRRRRDRRARERAPPRTSSASRRWSQPSPARARSASPSSRRR